MVPSIYLLLGEDDLKKGITTIQQKFHHDCYDYNRMDILFGERQNVTPSCIMMTGAPVVLNNIDRDGIILSENGAFLPADCDEYEYEEVEGGGDDDEESSDDESFIATMNKVRISLNSSVPSLPSIIRSLIILLKHLRSKCLSEWTGIV
jgi:hypothetical protein